MARFPSTVKDWSIDFNGINIARTAILFTLMSAYAITFPYLIKTFGPAIRLLSIVFVMPAALFWGLRWGLVIGLFTVILNFSLHIFAGIKFEGGIIGPISGFVAVALVGRLSDLGRQLKKNIEELYQTRDALQTSETKYRALFDMQSDAVFLVETETGRIVEANKAAENLFGYTRDELIQMSNTDLSEEPEKMITSMKKGIEKIPIFHVQKKNDALLPVEMTARHFELNGRKVSITALRDVTLRKKAEEEKRKFEKQLQQTIKMESIGTLAGGIAHDFNNILGAIIGSSELLKTKMKRLSRKYDFHLEQIFASANRAKDLVSQILTFSRQGESRKCAITVAPIIEDALQLLRATIPKTIEIRYNKKTKNDVIIADPSQIYQVVINLCANAVQAMPEKKGIISIELAEVNIDEEFVILHPEMEPGNHLEITIKDTGHGMVRSTLVRIFEPYFTTKEKGEGTGLGLSVVHGIIMHNNGCVTVDSKPGKGTTFKIYLPNAAIDINISQKQKTLLPKGTESILFVDDDPVLLKIMAEMLQMLGYFVEQRTGSLEALELFRTKPDAFDLIITDMNMPNMPGHELGMEINSINPRVPIIICTGFSDLIDEAKARKLGFKRLLIKPILLHDLAGAVRDTLDAAQERAVT